jgi:hypothetical protein
MIGNVIIRGETSKAAVPVFCDIKKQVAALKQASTYKSFGSYVVYDDFLS